MEALAKRVTAPGAASARRCVFRHSQNIRLTSLSGSVPRQNANRFLGRNEKGGRLKTVINLARNREFESTSLQRRVCKPSVPLETLAMTSIESTWAPSIRERQQRMNRHEQ
jgi:hypothetical protein